MSVRWGKILLLFYINIKKYAKFKIGIAHNSFQSIRIIYMTKLIINEQCERSMA